MLTERHPVHMQHISLPRDFHIHMDADEVAVRFSVTFIFLLLLACPDDCGHDYRWSADDFADVLVELGLI